MRSQSLQKVWFSKTRQKCQKEAKMTERQQIFLACFLGAGIGLAIVAAIAPVYCWIGIIIGGLVGYVSHEFGKVRKAASQAWREMRSVKTDWKVARKRVQMILLTLWAWFLLSLSCAIFCYGLAFLAHNPARGTLTAMFGRSSVGTVIISGYTFLLLLFSILNQGEKGEKIRKKLLLIARYGNPYKVYLWAILWKGICYYFFWKFIVGILILRFPAGVVFLAQFISRVFILIHTKERLLCLTDSALVTALGFILRLKGVFPWWVVLIGAALGGLFGVLDYEIISRRVLKVVPARQ